jgi:hypothetical protein
MGEILNGGFRHFLKHFFHCERGKILLFIRGKMVFAPWLRLGLAYQYADTPEKAAAIHMHGTLKASEAYW